MKRFGKIIIIISLFVISLFFLVTPSPAYYSILSAQPYIQSYYSLPSINININVNFCGFPGGSSCYNQPASPYGAYYCSPGYSYGYPPNSQYYSLPRYAASPVQLGGYVMGYGQYYSDYGYSPSQPHSTGYQPAYATSLPSSFDPYSPYGPFGEPFSSGYASSINPYESMQSQFKDADVSISYSDKGNDVSINTGQTLSIILPSNPDSGCRWYLDADKFDETIAVKESAEFFPGYEYSSSTSFGFTGAHEQWIFKAAAPGTTTIRLEIKESENSSALDTYEVEVTVAD
ncbi:MAG: protease inhibitor I42 family protein [bacterium]